MTIPQRGSPKRSGVSSTFNTNIDPFGSSRASTTRQLFPSPSNCPKVSSGVIAQHHPHPVNPPIPLEVARNLEIQIRLDKSGAKVDEMITEIGAGNESKIVIYDRELDGVPESRQIGGTFEIFLGGGFYKLQIRDGRNFVFVDGKAVEVIYENGRWKTLSK